MDDTEEDSERAPREARSRLKDARMALVAFGINGGVYTIPEGDPFRDDPTGPYPADEPISFEGAERIRAPDLDAVSDGEPAGDPYQHAQGRAAQAYLAGRTRGDPFGLTRADLDRVREPVDDALDALDTGDTGTWEEQTRTAVEGLDALYDDLPFDPGYEEDSDAGESGPGEEVPTALPRRNLDAAARALYTLAPGTTDPDR